MAVQIPMIQVPWKWCEEADWTLALRRYMASTLELDPDHYTEPIHALHRMRQDVRGVNKDITGRDLLYRYFSQLELLDLRFQLEKKPLELHFTWADVFGRSSVTQPSLAFEKACIIFNMGSILSHLGTYQDRSDPDGLRKASHYFMFAASMMVFISENFIHAPSVDLNASTLRVLKELMLAQAQECFLEKCLQEMKKDTLIAKITYQTAWMYTNVVENMTDCIKNGVFDDHWLSLCQIKQRYYQTAAQYHKGLAAESDGRYGEAVSRLTLAETHANDAVKLAQGFVGHFDPNSPHLLLPDTASCLHDLTHTIRELVREKLGMLTRDNDMVYHEVVPKTAILPPIDKVCMVKTHPLNEMYTSPGELQRVVGPDIFHQVLPMQIHESASVYDEEKAKLVRQCMEKADVADGEVDAAFSFMQLPTSLDKFRCGEAQLEPSLMQLADPPRQVRDWAQKLAEQDEAPGEALQDLIGTVENLRTQLRQALDASGIALDEEQRECEKNRVEFGDQWSQPPSGMVTAQYRKELRGHRESLEQALAADNDTLSRYQQLQALFNVLRSGYHGDELESAFIEMVHTGLRTWKAKDKGEGTLLDVGEHEPIGLAGYADRIQELAGQLAEVKRDRQAVLSEIKETARQDDISHILLLNRRNKEVEPQIFHNELAKYTPLLDRLSELLDTQRALIQSLSEAFRTLMELPEANRIQTAWDTVEGQRDRLVQQLEDAYNEYDEIRAHVRQGVTFYNDLAKLVNQVSSKIRAFCNERRDERERLASQLLHSKAEDEQRALRAELDRYHRSTALTGLSASESPSASAVRGREDEQLANNMRLLTQQATVLSLGGPAHVGTGPTDPKSGTPSQEGGADRYGLMTQEPLRRVSGTYGGGAPVAAPLLPTNPTAPLQPPPPVGQVNPRYPLEPLTTTSESTVGQSTWPPPKSIHTLVTSTATYHNPSAASSPAPRVPSCPEPLSLGGSVPVNPLAEPTLASQPPEYQPTAPYAELAEDLDVRQRSDVSVLTTASYQTAVEEPTQAPNPPATTGGPERLAKLFSDSPSDNVPDVFKTTSVLPTNQQMAPIPDTPLSGVGSLAGSTYPQPLPTSKHGEGSVFMTPPSEAAETSRVGLGNWEPHTSGATGYPTEGGRQETLPPTLVTRVPTKPTPTSVSGSGLNSPAQYFAGQLAGLGVLDQQQQHSASAMGGGVAATPTHPPPPPPSGNPSSASPVGPPNYQHPFLTNPHSSPSTGTPEHTTPNVAPHRGIISEDPLKQSPRYQVYSNNSSTPVGYPSYSSPLQPPFPPQPRSSATPHTAAAVGIYSSAAYPVQPNYPYYQPSIATSLTSMATSHPTTTSGVAFSTAVYSQDSASIYPSSAAYSSNSTELSASSFATPGVMAGVAGPSGGSPVVSQPVITSAPLQYSHPTPVQNVPVYPFTSLAPQPSGIIDGNPATSSAVPPHGGMATTSWYNGQPSPAQGQGQSQPALQPAPPFLQASAQVQQQQQQQPGRPATSGYGAVSQYPGAPALYPPPHHHSPSMQTHHLPGGTSYNTTGGSQISSGHHPQPQTQQQQPTSYHMRPQSSGAMMTAAPIGGAPSHHYGSVPHGQHPTPQPQPQSTGPPVGFRPASDSAPTGYSGYTGSPTIMGERPHQQLPTTGGAPLHPGPPSSAGQPGQHTLYNAGGHPSPAVGYSQPPPGSGLVANHHAQLPPQQHQHQQQQVLAHDQAGSSGGIAGIHYVSPIGGQPQAQSPPAPLGYHQYSQLPGQPMHTSVGYPGAPMGSDVHASNPSGAQPPPPPVQPTSAGSYYGQPLGHSQVHGQAPGTYPPSGTVPHSSATNTTVSMTGLGVDVSAGNAGQHPQYLSQQQHLHQPQHQHQQPPHHHHQQQQQVYHPAGGGQQVHGSVVYGHPAPQGNAYPQYQPPHQQQAPGMVPPGQQNPHMPYGSYAPPPPHQHPHQQVTSDYLTQSTQPPGGVPQHHGQSQQSPQGYSVPPQHAPATHNAGRNQTVSRGEANIRRRFSHATIARLESTTTTNATTDSTINQCPSDTVFITTPIYYVNAEPHIGHLYSSVLADTLARYHCQLRGRRVWFTTGTDEHGLKIQQAAQKSNEDTQTYCDRLAGRFRELCQLAQVNYDDFLRTTESRHVDTVQSIWKRLESKGAIYKSAYTGWYAVSDEAFYSDQQVVRGDGVVLAKETGAVVEWTEEENYKFRLSRWIEPLIQWLEESPQRVVPANRYQEVLTQLKQYREMEPKETCDLSISRPRSRLNWGIPVPGDAQHTVYVWLDALMSYLTVSQNHVGIFPPTLQVVGKDIIKFHAIFWPAFLMAAGLPLPKRIIAHAHWTMDHHKMSKSRGNVVNPFGLIKRYGVDTVRFFLMRDGGLVYDADFSEERIMVRYKESLVDQLGNLVARCSSKALSPDFNAFSRIGETLQAQAQTNTGNSGSAMADAVELSLPTADRDLVITLQRLPEAVAGAYEEADVRRALTLILDAIAQTNKYITIVEPWHLRKRVASEPGVSGQLARALYLGLETARLAGLLLSPVLPTKADQLLTSLGIPKSERQWSHVRFGAGWSDPGVDYNALAKSHSKIIFPRDIKLD
ncbi:bck1-like resistance to osmotic shock [Dispira parvispora]|uniref:Probable methionine--tRNA ligase, mitochondrial n=1 Tax=Dispira parvispora TaxID=1520584 RepID=A0A9W8AUH4_9FUNG|nr:bck1-like resistance to osmotic shock [Dispira parvispora]